MKQEMLINVAQPEECRIAIVEDGILEELYIERTSQDNYVGNIYKGKVVNLEPSIQAAFVDFGVGRNGFLHISDIEPQYYRQGGFDPNRPLDGGGRSQRSDIDTGDDDEGGDQEEHNGDEPQRRRSRGPRPGARPRIKPPIQDILRRGDEVLVQVIKEGIGTKGPTLSTYISIPGRYLVLMPALGRVGVSRKIEDDEVRRKLRDIMLELDPPKGLGFIVRTAGTDRTKRELSRDLAYLLRLWKVIVRRIKKQQSPIDIYEESDMIIRTIRDIFTADVDTIYIDEPSAYERAKEFLQFVMPRYVNRLQLYEGREPLFHKYQLDKEIALIQQRKVPLRQGGSIVIDQTEALVAIDVNSGNFRADDSAEETAYQMNLLAAREIARQLRLRDLGGVVVNDFIDMRKERHRRNVERAARRGETGPGPHQDLAHQPLRADRNDPPANPPQSQTERLPRLPKLPGRRRGKDGGEHGHRGHASVDHGHAAEHRQSDRDRFRRRGDLPQQPQAPRVGPARGDQQHFGAGAGAGTRLARASGDRMPRLDGPRGQTVACVTCRGERKNSGGAPRGLCPAAESVRPATARRDAAVAPPPRYSGSFFRSSQTFCLALSRRLV